MSTKMDFKNIPTTCYPAYTWLWNGRITKQEIKRQIDEMYASGIRAFYVIGEPETFRPQSRRTHLYPEYLSDEYLDFFIMPMRWRKKRECIPGSIMKGDSHRVWFVEKSAKSILSLL